MKGALKIIGGGSAIALGALVVAVLYLVFRTPPVDLLALPDELTPIESVAGRALLAESRYKADYEALHRNFESQSRRAFCGVASSVIVINALRNLDPRITQTTFFTPRASEARNSLRTSFTGMNLTQLGDLLRSHDLEPSITLASESHIDSFRALAKKNLETPGDFLLVNYQRAELAQGDVGHISPVAAYHLETDQFLILDVAAYKYPPVWVAAAALWNAMNTIDDSAGQSRGFVAVQERETR